MATLRAAAGESPSSITALLLQLSEGNREAEARLIPQVYDELRRLAGRYMRMERANHTLQPTALVHEAYARLVQQPQVPWQNRAHFFSVASQLMRHILVDHARARRTGKRGGIQQQVSLNDANQPRSEQSVDVLALNEVIERLEKLDPRQARIVELHFFGGLNFEEIARLLSTSERTVKREWSMARAWLRSELAPQ